MQDRLRFPLRELYFLVVRVESRIWNHLNELHHSSILVNQNVAVQHILAGIVHKPATHFEVACNVFGTRRWIGCWPALRIRLKGFRTLREAHLSLSICAF